TAILNTTGRETTERLTRLEAAIAARTERSADLTKSVPVAGNLQPAKATIAPAARSEQPIEGSSGKLDAMLMALAANQARENNDSMPANPAEDAPLLDPGFKNTPASWSDRDERFETVLEARREPIPAPASEVPLRPSFDPAEIERPARPQSSFAIDPDPFANPRTPVTAPLVEAPVSQSSTSTFVAAARRAQRARQETNAPASAAAASASAMGRALARFRPAKPAEGEAAPVEAPKTKKPAKAKREKPVAPSPVETRAPSFGDDTDQASAQPGFLLRYRRPLLLAAALATVSVLALNLVLQRSAEFAPAAAPAEVATPAESQPSAEQDISLVRPEPRVIDMIDDTSTGSINPASATTFAMPAAVTPMPTTLMASASEPKMPLEPLLAPTPLAPETKGSVPTETAAAPAPVTFNLPPENVGPQELRQAAADGDARAQFEIAAIYSEGRAVEQDYAEAAKWYERSAAQGLVPAEYRLGNLYETGTGVEKNLETAKLWYQRAAEAGNRMAMHNLAALYASGQMGDQEFESAAEWFQQAADRGMTDSQFNLGMLYARGLGLEQNFELSYKWFSLAAKSGDADASKARDDIAKSLNADAVGRVTAEIEAWKAQPIDLAANYAPLGTWSSQFDPGEAITAQEVVAKVQQALTKLGFDVGTPDGL
ncbi:MAG TPA: tetratricopeptide repeat protein, partial [Devosia sp.]